MMESSNDALAMQRWKEFSTEVESLLQSPSQVLGEANPPNTSGVYVLYDENMTLSYVGIATDLRNRLLNKHLSGDESHAIQRAYKLEYPDRAARREFIKHNVRAKWMQVDDPARAADLERLLIWLFQPPWNLR
jgi:excinuclease UvrABC nuclease subunit